jgi:hemoglobin
MTQVPGAQRRFGDGDTSFLAAGGEPGLRSLAQDFYHQMDTLETARRIRAMHPSDLTESIDKLALFLCGWLGGPKLFRSKYGPIKLPVAHEHLKIDDAEREAWLTCMQAAIAQQPFEPDFRAYLLGELHVPAGRIMDVSQNRRGERRKK